MNAGFQVRPEELAAAGSAALALAARIPPAADRLAGGPAQAAAGLTGWRTAAALQACGDSWRSLLTTLARELDTQGHRLTATADQYRAGDLSVVDAFVSTLASH
ncbi:type VII secretion target [Kitasatospora azatica]|uniref:type VII secretion target n=1 Tax=Kitasatospora azatica TaxID=58347 RepID=UPI00055E60F4|nr:type VII secretion target [Kitasatospora azatica]